MPYNEVVDRRAPHILTPPHWQRPLREATPEALYLGRRAFLRTMGFAGLGAVAALSGCDINNTTISSVDPLPAPPCDPETDLPPTDFTPLSGVSVNPGYAVKPARGTTRYQTAIGWNNFYEFGQDRRAVWCRSKDFRTSPWSVEIAGLTQRPRTVDFNDILGIAPLEERVYRHRCVEAWAMTIPWIGIPLARFIEWCAPTSDATHVRFVSFYDAEQMPDIYYVWPYHEALRLDEATNELALLGVGMYGNTLPPQNGAPLRIVVPWKYGYKSIKSIARVEFLDSEPVTFWNEIDDVYTFFSNVDPTVPHTLWSQAQELIVGTDERMPTLPYNGYGEWVAGLYR